MNTTREMKNMRSLIVCVAALLLGLAVAQSDSLDAAVASSKASSSAVRSLAPQSKKKITVPAGTRILVRMIDSIDSSKQKTGYRFTASLETNLQVDDVVVAPRGTLVYGRLASAESSGRMSGSSQLTLELTDIMIKGTAYPLLTSTYEIKGKGEGGNTAK